MLKTAHQYAKIVLENTEGNLTYADKVAHAMQLIAKVGETAVGSLIDKWLISQVNYKALRRQRRKMRGRKAKVVKMRQPIDNDPLDYKAQTKRRPKTRCRYGARTYGTGIYAGQDEWSGGESHTL